MMKDTINFTPQESEQLSKFVSDEEFVQTQKKDIEELSTLFKDMLTDEANGGDEYYTAVLKDHFVKQNVNASYYLIIDDKKKSVVVQVKQGELNCYLGIKEDADIVAKLKKETFDKVVTGRMTFQRAFMTGEITAKGNLKVIKMFDELFKFER
jgi:putative sterol carrier protein